MYLYRSTYTYMYICIYICIDIFTYIHTCIRIYIYNTHLYKYIYTHICTCHHARSNTHTYMCTCPCAHTYTYVTHAYILCKCKLLLYHHRKRRNFRQNEKSLDSHTRCTYSFLNKQKNTKKTRNLSTHTRGAHILSSANNLSNPHKRCTYTSRSLLQNIVSFIRLFCKRDLLFLNKHSLKSTQEMHIHFSWHS